MKKELQHSNEEYKRLCDEMLFRLEKLFSQGYTLVSIIAAYLALVVTGLVTLIAQTDIINSFTETSFVLMVFFGVIFTVLFGMPVFLVSPFAVKSHDSFRAIASISAYTKVFFEYPSIWFVKHNIKKEDGNVESNIISWETLHCDAQVKKLSKHFNSEYLYVAAFSLLLSIFCLAALLGWTIYFILTTKTLWSIAVSIVIFLLGVGYIAFLVIYLSRIKMSVNIKKHIQVYPKGYFEAYLESAIDAGFMKQKMKKNVGHIIRIY